MAWQSLAVPCSPCQPTLLRLPPLVVPLLQSSLTLQGFHSAQGLPNTSATPCCGASCGVHGLLVVLEFSLSRIQSSIGLDMDCPAVCRALAHLQPGWSSLGDPGAAWPWIHTHRAHTPGVSLCSGPGCPGTLWRRAREDPIQVKKPRLVLGLFLPLAGDTQALAQTVGGFWGFACPWLKTTRHWHSGWVLAWCWLPWDCAAQNLEAPWAR